jgi:hypothetical protein
MQLSLQRSAMVRPILRFKWGFGSRGVGRTIADRLKLLIKEKNNEVFDEASVIRFHVSCFPADGVRAG